jgi:hypothetical protein
VAAHLVSTLTDGLSGILDWPSGPAVRLARLINWLGAVQSSRRPRSPSACVASLISGGVRRRTGRGIRWLTCWCTAATSEVPLGMPFEPDPELAAVALDFLTGPWPIGVVPMDRLHGVSLRDTATGRVWRKGAEIRGSVGADRTTCEMLLLRVSYPAIRHSKNERKGRTSMKHDWSTEELAAQWNLLPTETTEWLHYEWRGRTIEYHRAQIRARLGLRQATVEDGEALAVWLEDYDRRERFGRNPHTGVRFIN